MPRTFLVRRTALEIQSSSTDSEEERQDINLVEPAVNQEIDRAVLSDYTEVNISSPTAGRKTIKSEVYSPGSAAKTVTSVENSPTYLSRAVSSAIRVDSETGAIENSISLLKSIVKEEPVDSELDAEVAYHTDKSFSSHTTDTHSFSRPTSVSSVDSIGSHTPQYNGDISETSSERAGNKPLSLPLITPHQPLPPFASLAYNVFVTSRNSMGETVQETANMETEPSKVIKLPLRLPLRGEKEKEHSSPLEQTGSALQNIGVPKDIEIEPVLKSEIDNKETENKRIGSEKSSTECAPGRKSAPKIWNPFHHVSTPKPHKVLPVSLNTNTPSANICLNSLPSPHIPLQTAKSTENVIKSSLPSATMTSPQIRSDFLTLHMEHPCYSPVDIRYSPYPPENCNSFQTVSQINSSQNLTTGYSPRITSPFLPYRTYYTPEIYMPSMTSTPSRTSTPIVSPIPTTPVQVNERTTSVKAQKRPCTPVMETPKRMRIDNLPFQIYKEIPSPSFDHSVSKLPYNCPITPTVKANSVQHQENISINLNRSVMSNIQPKPLLHSRSPVVLGPTSFSKENIPHADSKTQKPPQKVEVINGGYGIKNPSFVPPKPADITNIQQDENGKGSFVCKVCGKEFAIQRLLNRHLKCHSETKRYLCTFCGKGFNDTFDLKRHTRIHTGVKPYKCEHCEKAFTQRCSLESHCRKVHNMELNYGYKQRRNKTYVCEDCGHSTTDPEVHFNHLKERHPNCPTLSKPHDKRHFKFQSNERPSSGPLRPRN